MKLSHCLEIDTEEISMTQPKYDTHVVNRDLANNWNFSLNYEKMKSYRKVLFKTSTRQVYNGPQVYLSKKEQVLRIQGPAEIC